MKKIVEKQDIQDGFIPLSRGCRLFSLKKDTIINMCKKNIGDGTCYLSSEKEWMVHSSVFKSIKMFLNGEKGA